MLLDLRLRGIEPLVTLHHFVLPAWLAERGGITAKEFPDQFAKYALHVVHRLASGPAHVRWWMTFNEPMVLISAGYVTGEWPPNKKELLLALAAITRIAQAHITAVQAVRRAQDLPRDLQFSVANHWRDFQATGFGFLNGKIAKLADLIFNRWILDMISRSTLDYLGINYYGRSVIHPQWKPPFVTVDEGAGRTTDIGWVIYPEGLGHVLKEVNDAYHLPILVSENGIADATDKQRPEFLKQHIAEIRAARQQNIPVIGYLHWTLTDNFEWARGFGARFGLVELDPATGERKPRPSFQVYKDLIRRELATDALAGAR
jgi:beta-glucosidase